MESINTLHPVFVYIKQANERLLANQEIINNVNQAAVDTQALLLDANAAIDTVNSLFDRVTAADNKATGANGLVNGLFAEGTSTLRLLEDFSAEITGKFIDLKRSQFCFSTIG